MTDTWQVEVCYGENYRAYVTGLTRDQAEVLRDAWALDVSDDKWLQAGDKRVRKAAVQSIGIKRQ